MADQNFKINVRITQSGAKRTKTAIKDLDGQTRSFVRNSNKASTATAAFRRSMSGLRNNLLLVGFAFAPIVIGINKVVKTAAKFESVKARLVGLMGGIRQAEQAFGTFNKVAATTPFTLEDVVNAGAQLKAFGADAESLIKPVTDLAAFMGTTATEAANSLGRAFAGGAGAADILRERGILNLIKDTQGISDLSKTTLPEFRRALIETIQDPATGIAGSTDRMSKTFVGSMSNMLDSVTRLANEIGKFLIPPLKFLADTIGIVADRATMFFKRMSGEIQLTSVGFAGALNTLMEPALLKFSDSLHGLDIDQAKKKLKSLEDEFRSAEKPAIVLNDSISNLKDGVETITPIFNKGAKGFLTVNEALNEGGVSIGEFKGSLGEIIPAYQEFLDKQSESATATVASMEVDDASTIVIQKKIDIIKAFIESLIAQKEAEEMVSEAEKQRALDLMQVFELEKIAFQEGSFAAERERLAIHQEEVLSAMEKLGLSEQELEASRTNAKKFFAEKRKKIDMDESKAKLQALNTFASQTANAISVLKLSAEQTAAVQAMAAMVNAFAAAQDTYALVSKFAPPPAPQIAYGASLAVGLVNAAKVATAADEIKAAATGTDFVTSGPQLMLVGENAGGRERVQVTPLSSPNINGPQGGGVTVNISAPMVDETVVDHIIPAIQRASNLNLA